MVGSAPPRDKNVKLFSESRREAAKVFGLRRDTISK